MSTYLCIRYLLEIRKFSKKYFDTCYLSCTSDQGINQNFLENDTFKEFGKILVRYCSQHSWSPWESVSPMVESRGNAPSGSMGEVLEASALLMS